MSKLFLFEGIDGAGKTTVAKVLAKKWSAVYLQEPGKEKVRKLIRRAILQKIDPLTEVLLFLAARRETYLEIKKYLSKKKLVFLDRSFPSTLAYQLKAKNLEKIWPIEEFLAFDHLVRFHLEPELIFIFDLPVKIAWQRIKRKKTKFEEKKLLTKVRKAYLSLASKYHWQIVPANLSLTEVIKLVDKQIKDRI